MKKVPRLLPGVDIKKLKLDATDGYLLSRIDGKLAPDDLSRETGLPDFSVARALEKLEKLGVIEIVDPNAPPPKPPEPPKPAVVFDVSALPPKYDASELEEAADLTVEQKKKILDYFYRLEDLDHYQLLGVDKASDKKTIKRAYNALAAVFHPDRYFKKNLGGFKQKMTEIFTKVTEANDTLVDNEQRTEYDAYLAEVATTRGMEAMLEQAVAASAKAAADAQAQVAAAPPPAPAPAPEPVPAGPSPAEIAARKAALAARLRAGGRPPMAAPAPKPVEAAPSPLKYANSQDAVDALKRRYEQRIEHATQAQAQRYVQAAEDALAKNDLVSAATSLGIASKLAPEDLALGQRAKEVKVRADATLLESYLKQANYEEKQRHWNEAARSWLKAAKIKDDAHTHERAANAILRSDEPDLREAADHAKRAVALEPGNVAHHATLVEIYIQAGLSTSAKRAAEAAHTVDPKNERLLALIKRIQENKA
jgi:hypothetical protein